MPQQPTVDAAPRGSTHSPPPRPRPWMMGAAVALGGAGLGYAGSWLLGSCTTCATGSSPALFAAATGVVAGLAAAVGARG